MKQRHKRFERLEDVYRYIVNYKIQCDGVSPTIRQNCMIEHLYPFIESKKSEIGGMAASLQPQHALPGCKAWIDYDAVTQSLLIYFDGKPVESYVNWVDSRLATLHDCESDAIVGVLISNMSQKQA